MDAECVIPPARLVEEAQADDKTWTTAGTGWDAYQEVLAGLPFNLTHGDVLYPDSQDIVILAEQEFKKGNIVPVEDSSPVYLRDNVTWKKLPGRE